MEMFILMLISCAGGATFDSACSDLISGCWFVVSFAGGDRSSWVLDVMGSPGVGDTTFK